MYIDCESMYTQPLYRPPSDECGLGEEKSN